MKRALILFDVDGTLLITGGATTRCIWRAAEATFGRSLTRCSLTAGLLDPQLFMAIAAHCGIERGEEHLDRYKSLYLAELERELLRVRQDVKVMPGIVPLLEDLSKKTDRVTLGILTGNFRQATMLKLAAAGLNRFEFPVGAFAEDGSQRVELVDSAMRQFTSLTRESCAPQQVIIIGDTPRDIATARAAGCRVLSVATGGYSFDQLQAEGPDAGVQDLLDPRPLWELIELAAIR